MALTIHHIVVDGWSVGVLVRDVSAFYTAYVQGRPAPQPELAVQYGDYAIWQRQWLRGELLQEELQYWREQLDGAPAQLELPTDRPRPAIASFKGALFYFLLSRDLCSRLEEFARCEGATLFMVFLATYQWLLALYTGQRDIVVGSPIAGRTDRNMEAMIGFFVNTLVLRTDLSDAQSFRSLLKRVKETTLGAHAHQHLPYGKLVEELRPERNLSHQPIFQVGLAVQNTPHEQPELAGLTWKQMIPEHATAIFDLTLCLFEPSDALRGVPEGWRGEFEYSTDLFDPQTIERMAEHYRLLLERILADPDGALL